MDTEAIFAEYEGAIRRLANKYFAPGMDKEDMAQEARIGLWSAIQDFDEKNGVPFGAFANLVVKRHLMTVITAANRGKHNILNSAASIDKAFSPSARASETVTLGDILPEPSLNPEDRFLAVEGAKGLGTLAKQILSKGEQATFSAFMAGTHYQGKEQGTPEYKAVDNALSRVKRKLRTALAA